MAAADEPDSPTFRQAVRGVLESLLGRAQMIGPSPALIGSAVEAIVELLPLLTYGELSGQPNPRDV